MRHGVRSAPIYKQDRRTCNLETKQQDTITAYLFHLLTEVSIRSSGIFQLVATAATRDGQGDGG